MADEGKGGCGSDIVHQKVFVCDDEEEEEFKWKKRKSLNRV